MKSHCIIIVFALLLLISIGCKPSNEINTKTKVIVVGPNTGLRSIQAAVNVASPGYTVRVLSGTYHLEEAILLLFKKNINIIGEGDVELICKDMYSNVISIESSENIIIKNLKARHIKPPKGEICTGNVFYIEDSGNVFIQNCEINGCGAIGVYANTDDLILKDNHIHQNSNWSVKFKGTNLDMESNLIENNGHENQMDINGELISKNTNNEETGLRMESNAFERKE